MAEARAVFLDRDGVIDDPVVDERSGPLPESPLRPADVRLADGAVAGLRLLRELGYVLIVASNQPAAAKGSVTLDELRAVHDRVVELLASAGIALDDYKYCFHHPNGDGSHAELGRPCNCRKPAPGMLLDAAAEHDIDLAASWMVGDSGVDVDAGHAAGCRVVLVAAAQSAHRRGGGSTPNLHASDLADAARRIAAHAASGEKPA